MDRIMSKEELDKRRRIDLQEIRKVMVHPISNSFSIVDKKRVNDNYYIIKIVENLYLTQPNDDIKEVHVDSQMANFLEYNKSYMMLDLY